MSFWKSERFEYIRQPHIIGLIIVIVFVVVAAVYTALVRIGEQKALSNMESVNACIKLVEDERLCKFALTSEQTTNQAYSSITKDTADGITTINTVYFENLDRISFDTAVDNERTESMITIDADSWVLDTTDGLWAHYNDPDFAPSSEETAAENSYDFSSPASTDVTEFRNNYTFAGEVPCDNLTCFKYEVVAEGYDEVFILFDTKDFLLRQHYGRIGANSTTTTYGYNDIVVKAPTEPTKEVDYETFNRIAGLEDTEQETDDE